MKNAPPVAPRFRKNLRLDVSMAQIHETFVSSGFDHRPKGALYYRYTLHDPVFVIEIRHGFDDNGYKPITFIRHYGRLISAEELMSLLPKEKSEALLYHLDLF